MFYEAVITSTCSAQLLDKCVGISQVPGAAQGVATMSPFSVLKTSPRSWALPRDEASAVRTARPLLQGLATQLLVQARALFQSCPLTRPPGPPALPIPLVPRVAPRSPGLPRPHTLQDAYHFTGSLPQLDCNLEVRGHQDTRLSVSRAEWKHGWYSGPSLIATTENDKYRRYPRKKKNIT